MNLDGFSVKIIFHIIQQSFSNFFICICKITCKPMGNFAENLNLGNRFRPPPDPSQGHGLGGVLNFGLGRGVPLGILKCHHPSPVHVPITTFVLSSPPPRGHGWRKRERGQGAIDPSTVQTGGHGPSTFLTVLL